jgi:hypothetical protein
MRSATDATPATPCYTLLHPATPCYTVKTLTVPTAFFLRNLHYSCNHPQKIHLPSPVLVKAQLPFFEI